MPRVPFRLYNRPENITHVQFKIIALTMKKTANRSEIERKAKQNGTQIHSLREETKNQWPPHRHYE